MNNNRGTSGVSAFEHDTSCRIAFQAVSAKVLTRGINLRKAERLLLKNRYGLLKMLIIPFSSISTH